MLIDVWMIVSGWLRDLGWVLGLNYVFMAASMLLAVDAGEYVALVLSILTIGALYLLSFRIEERRSDDSLRMEIAKRGRRFSNWSLLSRSIQWLLVGCLVVSAVVTALLAKELALQLVWVPQLMHIGVLCWCRSRVVLAVRI